MFLLFQLGNDRYVLEASRVVEVLPLLELKKFRRRQREWRDCLTIAVNQCRRLI